LVFTNHIIDSQRIEQKELNNRFLRTGDLGFIQEGELYFCGRLKDLIILKGVNYYPQDLEILVEQSHPGIVPSAVAAFSIQKNNEVVATSSVIYRHDLKYGDVGSFCKSAVVTKKGDIVNVFCGPQADPEGYTTRGSATVDFTNGLASIQVRGEHLDSGKWIVDINQKCDQMEPVP
jgi:acyl-CoA synthetase (AMP-forming)/AMP-acid ligase II